MSKRVEQDERTAGTTSLESTPMAKKGSQAAVKAIRNARFKNFDSLKQKSSSVQSKTVLGVGPATSLGELSSTTQDLDTAEGHKATACKDSYSTARDSDVATQTKDNAKLQLRYPFSQPSLASHSSTTTARKATSADTDMPSPRNLSRI